MHAIEPIVFQEHGASADRHRDRREGFRVEVPGGWLYAIDRVPGATFVPAPAFDPERAKICSTLCDSVLELYRAEEAMHALTIPGASGAEMDAASKRLSAASKAEAAAVRALAVHLGTAEPLKVTGPTVSPAASTVPAISVDAAPAAK